MAFRANSLQGSLVVWGTKDACELPEIPGRGIWNFGTQKVVQTPFVDEKTIKAPCVHIGELFQSGKRKLLSPMFGDAAKSKITKQNAVLYMDKSPRNSESVEGDDEHN